MPILLNYKSYYEAFKRGVVDDGYTPVARLLFEPLFDPFGSVHVFDEKGELYEADTKNSNAWGHGYEQIPENIMKAAGKNESLEVLIEHFTSKKFKALIIEAKEDEMFEEMVSLVKNCENLTDFKKKQLLKYYHGYDSFEFLARVFQQALLGNNKVASSKKKKKAADNESDSIVEFNQLVRRKKPEVKVPKEVRKPELKYVTQLYAAYSDAAGKEITEAGDLDPLNYRDDFEHHRKNYYKAELVCRETRDSVQPDEASPVDVLKEEMEEGVYETRHHGYDNALLRVNAVMEQASKVQLSSWVDQATFNWVGPSEKKGVCHILVNDERFKWVD